MKIVPPVALSRIASRFHERRARAEKGEAPPLTRTDEENIEGFGAIISALTELLEQENSALREGDVMQVAALFEQKNELLRRLEIRKPVIEPFLRENIDFNVKLRGLIQGLTQQINTNAQLLSAMSEASSRIRHEVNRVRERHSLQGMYDKTGQKRSADGVRKPDIFDKNV